MIHKNKSPEIIELLRKITDGATSEASSLSEVLRLCMRLGSMLEYKELTQWAREEATGYPDIESLPDYRLLSCDVKAKFSGPMGSGIDNAQVPQSVVDKDHRDFLFNAQMTQSVAELERLAKDTGDEGNNTLMSPWPGDIIAYYQRKEIYQGYVLGAAWRVLTRPMIVGILETIRTRVLDFVLAIEKELKISSTGTVKEPKIEIPKQDKVQHIFNTTITNPENVAFGNSGDVTQQSFRVEAGDLESLKTNLKEIGLPPKHIKELEKALEEDASSKEQPGPSTQGWLARTMIMIGKGSLALGTNTAGSLIANMLMQYLGLQI